MANSARRNSGAAQAVRVVVAVLAALVIAFCGWSAYQYANGSDPLAFLGGNTLQTVEEGSSSSPSLELTSSSVTDDDVKGQIAQLKYGSDDVSLSTGDVNVVLGKDGIWIENASDSTADDAITSTARRAAALHGRMRRTLRSRMLSGLPRTWPAPCALSFPILWGVRAKTRILRKSLLVAMGIASRATRMLPLVKTTASNKKRAMLLFCPMMRRLPLSSRPPHKVRFLSRQRNRIVFLLPSLKRGQARALARVRVPLLKRMRALPSLSPWMVLRLAPVALRHLFRFLLEQRSMTPCAQLA